ncbi:hypothetical protein PV326_013762 [Microctonus aethiopoides]|nr:hypothetical protein PV326_013762 [Microctonus aethiopoides]
MPNDSSCIVIDSYLCKYKSVNAYYNHSLEFIENFIESVQNVAKSCNENSVRDLAKSIEALFKNGKQAPTNEFEVRRVGDAYMLQYFGDVVNERFTIDGNRCDSLVWDEIECVLLLIEWKFGKLCKRNSSKAGHTQIFEKGYDTLLKGESLKTFFSIDSSIVKRRNYFGIHVAENYITSITYSFGRNDKSITVCSSDCF